MHYHDEELPRSTCCCRCRRAAVLLCCCAAVPLSYWAALLLLLLHIICFFYYTTLIPTIPSYHHVIYVPLMLGPMKRSRALRTVVYMIVSGCGGGAQQYSTPSTTQHLILLNSSTEYLTLLAGLELVLGLHYTPLPLSIANN